MQQGAEALMCAAITGAPAPIALALILAIELVRWLVPFSAQRLDVLASAPALFLGHARVMRDHQAPVSKVVLNSARRIGIKGKLR